MSDRLSDEDLREALMLDEKATARPWVADDPERWDGRVEVLRADVVRLGGRTTQDVTCDGARPVDAALIARYRNDYPAAASELLRLREGLHVLVDVMRPSDRLPRGIVDTDRSGPSPRLSLEAINLLAGRKWDDDGEVT